MTLYPSCFFFKKGDTFISLFCWYMVKACAEFT